MAEESAGSDAASCVAVVADNHVPPLLGSVVAVVVDSNVALFRPLECARAAESRLALDETLPLRSISEGER